MLIYYNTYFSRYTVSVYAKIFNVIMLQMVYIFSTVSSFLQDVVQLFGLERFAKYVLLLWDKMKSCCRCGRLS